MLRRWIPLVLVPILAACGSTPSESGAGGGGGHGGASTTSGSAASGGPATSGSQSTSGTGSGSGGASASSSTSGSSASSSASSSAASSSASSSAASSSASSSAASSSSSSGGQMGSVCSHNLPEYTNNNGSVTFYTLSMGAAQVNCSFPVTQVNPDIIAHVDTGGGKYFAAMNTADYNNAATCGACVEVTRDNNKKVVATVVDQCPTNGNPKCKAGHIDLSQPAFLQIGTQAEGYLGTGNGGAVGSISWKYVPCPTNGDVFFRLKDPANMNWNQILVEGHRYAINKLEVMVNGQWQNGTRQSYNYWQVGNGNMGSPPYKVRVTDVNGDIVQAQLNLVAGDQPANAQFPVCQ